MEVLLLVPVGSGAGRRRSKVKSKEETLHAARVVIS